MAMAVGLAVGCGTGRSAFFPSKVQTHSTFVLAASAAAADSISQLAPPTPQSTEAVLAKRAGNAALGGRLNSRTILWS